MSEEAGQVGDLEVVTRVMIDAGLDVYVEMNPEVERASEIVARIYRVMLQAKLETISPTA